MNENVCVFPGSFNPFTLGHRHLAELALEKYDKVIIAVAGETYKGDMLGADERVKIARESLANDARFDVKYFSGMLTDFLAETGCFNVVRGYRDEKDYEYEKELERIYVSMDRRVNFVLLRSAMAEISSEKVRRAAAAGGSLDGLVAPGATDDIRKYYGK